METWPSALGGYITAMKAAGRASGTIRLHRHYLAELSARYDGPWKITIEDLRDVLAAHDWAPETRKSARSVYRTFYTWGHGNGYTDANPAAALETIRVPAADPRPTPEFIVRKLLRDAPPRTKFMALPAAHLGMRVAEISRVHARDYGARRLLVHGKGGKTRTAYVADDGLVEMLEAVEGWAFEGLPGRPMSPGHVCKLLSQALPDGWTGHTLRHRAATTAHDLTGNIFAVSKMLGHSQVATTQRYVAISDRAVIEAYKAAAA